MPGRRLWLDSNQNLTASSGGASQQTLMAGIAVSQTRFDQMTLLRTIIGIDVGYSVHDAGEGSQLVSIGIGVTTAEAFAASVLPDPEVEADFPVRGWIWRARYRVFGFAADQPAVFTRRVDLDLRSQRKLENGVAFINIQNTAVEGVSSTVLMTGLVRQLWLVS